MAVTLPDDGDEPVRSRRCQASGRVCPVLFQTKESKLMSDGATLAIPRGFRACGVTAGLRESGALDMAVLAADAPCAAAGTFTTNRVCAAPVKWCRQVLPADDIRAIVINSGNANAATGDQGLANAQRTAEIGRA